MYINLMREINCIEKLKAEVHDKDMQISKLMKERSQWMKERSQLELLSSTKQIDSIEREAISAQTEEDSITGKLFTNDTVY